MATILNDVEFPAYDPEQAAKDKAELDQYRARLEEAIDRCVDDGDGELRLIAADARACGYDDLADRAEAKAGALHRQAWDEAY